MTHTAWAAAMATEHSSLPTRPGENFAGYGVMGLPFDSGHYLALRRFPANGIGGAYNSVWHRDPNGNWVFYDDAPAMSSCPRYFDAALHCSRTAAIRLQWPAMNRLRVTVDDALDWVVHLRRTPATAALSALGGAVPGPLWAQDWVLTVLGRCASVMLGAGRLGLSGRLPNGQAFQAGPRQVWAVAASTARLHGVDLGSPAPLQEQVKLGDFWLPQRGLFAVGTVWTEAFDPTRHRTARTSLTQ